MTKQQLREAIRRIIRQELNENAPAETKPKPGVKEKEPPAEKPGKRREFVPKPGADPRPKAKTKVTMEEASKLKDIIQRFKSKK